MEARQVILILNDYILEKPIGWLLGDEVAHSVFFSRNNNDGNEKSLILMLIPTCSLGGWLGTYNLIKYE